MLELPLADGVCGYELPVDSGSRKSLRPESECVSRYAGARGMACRVLDNKCPEDLNSRKPRAY